MTQQNTDARASIISKMRKLAAMTQAAGCSEAEAATAASKLATLLAEHNISQDELSTRAEALECEAGEFMVFGQDGWWLDLAGACGTACATRVWRRRQKEDVLGLGYESEVSYLRFFGFPADVAASIAMFSVCHTAVMGEGLRERSRIARESFIIGMISRLCERLRALKPRETSGSTGRSVLVLKDQLIDDAWLKYQEANGMHLRNKGASRAANARAFARGQAAGERISLRGDGSALYGARQIEGRR